MCPSDDLAARLVAAEARCVELRKALARTVPWACLCTCPNAEFGKHHPHCAEARAALAGGGE